MEQYWILVADSARARIFSRDKKFSPLEEIETLVHPESRLHRQDLVTDRPGKVQESMTAGEYANDEPTDPKTTEARQFARDISQQLRESRVAGSFRHLVLVAEPKFLGLLRKSLDPGTRDLVTAEVAKNLVRESAEGIARTVDGEL